MLPQTDQSGLQRESAVRCLAKLLVVSCVEATIILHMHATNGRMLSDLATPVKCWARQCQDRDGQSGAFQSHGSIADVTSRSVE